MKELKIGAILNFLLAILHVACMFFLDKALKFYGVDTAMYEICGGIDILPYIITSAITLCFFAAGCYALSATGDMPRLPMQRTALLLITIIFMWRAVMGIAKMAQFGFAWIDLSSVIIAGIIGSLYLRGIIKKF